MSMSVSVYGIRPPDKKWEKMAAAYNACKEAGLSIPPQIDTFFDGSAPDPKGVIIRLTKDHGVSEYHGDGESGLVIDVSKLPKDITEIRFVNSW